MLIHKEQVCQAEIISFYFIYIIRIVVATCALDAQIKLWDIESGKLIRDIDATPGII
jgi:WD40 repeat protein